MARKTKFRGRDVETGDFIYGNLIGTNVVVGEIVDWDDEYFCTAFWRKVHPETVGQMVDERDGVEYYEGDTVKYISKEQTGTRVKYKRRGYDTYAEYSDIEVTGVIARGEHEGLLTWIVKTDQCTKYESYFWGEGRRTDRPQIITNNLTKPFSTKRKYEIVGSPHLLQEQGEKE